MADEQNGGMTPLEWAMEPVPVLRLQELRTNARGEKFRQDSVIKLYVLNVSVHYIYGYCRECIVPGDNRRWKFSRANGQEYGADWLRIHPDDCATLRMQVGRGWKIGMGMAAITRNEKG